MDQELEDFKRRIDLREYAASLGYELDRKESSRGSSVMRSADNKVIIKRGSDGHFVYFSVRDDNDNGSIIDFAQKRQDLNLGQVRKELRPWIGRLAPSLPLFSPLDAAPKSRAQIERNYADMRLAHRHDYLEVERKIPAALLGSARFVGRVRVDQRGNAVFPHFDHGGLCGYELKNHSFTGFASGGEKGLWESHDQPQDTALVFTEDAIDALSHAALYPNAQARYRSVGGTLNPKQPDLIKAAIVEMPAGAVIVCATDNDAEGHKLARMMEECFAVTTRTNLHFKRHAPEENGLDWNDVLRTSLPASDRPAPFPTALPVPR